MAYRVPNPGVCGGVKPVSLITDRAKRYRANSAACRPGGPKVCLFCDSKANVGVHHLDGNEDHTNPNNLAWACKSCNAKIAAEHKRLGRGKRVRQFNPDRVLKAETVLQAAGYTRSRGEHETWNQPRGRRQILLDFGGNEWHAMRAGVVEQIGRLDDSSLASLLARKGNPEPIPNLAQYTLAVASHVRGRNDSGGKVIHATPPAVRRRYAAEIWRRRRERGTDAKVPF